MKSLRDRAWLIVLIAIGVASGCASRSALRPYREHPHLERLALHGVLDRWERWRSLTAECKLVIRLPGETLRTRGHVFFLAGERYEVGFSKPFDRFVGNFYVTPSQFIYWDVKATPLVYGPGETLSLERMLARSVPNWDPRDLLPFPVSGRTGGFQPDSVWRRGDVIYVRGQGDGASRTLTISGVSGRILEESVARADRDLIIKRYSRHGDLSGWPVARRVVCSDPAERASFTWTLRDVVLDADEFVPASLISDSVRWETSP